MVKSGLKKDSVYGGRPRVSPYRLFVHLNTAIIIYSGLLWNGLTLLRKPQEHLITPSLLPGSRKLRGLSVVLLHCLAFNIMTGVTVAGIDAGKVFNDWPLMNGKFIPDGYLAKSPALKNFFENAANVQFNHRMFAYITYSFVTYMFFSTRGLAMLPAQ